MPESTVEDGWTVADTVPVPGVWVHVGEYSRCELLGHRAGETSIVDNKP